jgi:hypothetical protein
LTIEDLIAAAGQHPGFLVAAFMAPPLGAWLAGRVHGPGGGARAPWRQVYALLVYAACVPGMLAAVLTAYAMFFTQTNLLQVDLLVYLLPLASMGATLFLVGRYTRFDDVPGFDRLTGLMTMIAVSFGVALAVAKSRLWVVFGGSIFLLFAIAAFAFGLIKWGAWKLTRGSPRSRD